MEVPKQNDIRCPVCLSEFHLDSMNAAGVKACPTCKTGIAPIYIKHDGYIRTNWQDLRVLAIYSVRWSQIFDKKNPLERDALRALEHILDKIRKFQPQGALPLTLENEKIIIDVVRRAPPKPPPDGSIVSPFFGKQKLD